ncbi:Inner membrane protein yccS [Citrobacter freundii]|nr:Inner membrane protein yccS [Citrobacter freundii]
MPRPRSNYSSHGHGWFAIGLTLSTSGFILLGGLGQRYATIAFGALLIAIYTMLGTSLYEQWYQQPILLLAGAIWYNLLTLIGHLLFPIRPLQDNLARSYEQLAHYLELKSRLFDPDIEDESQAPLYDLALANGQLMATLNQTKVSLLTRLAWRPRTAEGHVARCITILWRRIFTNAQAPRIFSIKRCVTISATAT